MIIKKLKQSNTCFYSYFVIQINFGNYIQSYNNNLSSCRAGEPCPEIVSELFQHFTKYQILKRVDNNSMTTFEINFTVK